MKWITPRANAKPQSRRFRLHSKSEVKKTNFWRVCLSPRKLLAIWPGRFCFCSNVRHPPFIFMFNNLNMFVCWRWCGAFSSRYFLIDNKSGQTELAGTDRELGAKFDLQRFGTNCNWKFLMFVISRKQQQQDLRLEALGFGFSFGFSRISGGAWSSGHGVSLNFLAWLREISNVIISDSLIVAQPHTQLFCGLRWASFGQSGYQKVADKPTKSDKKYQNISLIGWNARLEIGAVNIFKQLLLGNYFQVHPMGKTNPLCPIVWLDFEC